MKKGIPLLLAMRLTACGTSKTPRQANVPIVGELAADPARLKEVRQQCWTDRATLGYLLCNRVARSHAQAVLWHDGKVRYIPSNFNYADKDITAETDLKPQSITDMRGNLFAHSGRRDTANAPRFQED